MPSVPPRIPSQHPAQPAAGTGFDLVGWVSAKRHRAPAGVFSLGPEPRPSDERTLAEDAIPGWKLLLRAGLNALVAWELFVYAQPAITWTFTFLFPGEIAAVQRNDSTAIMIANILWVLTALLLIWIFGRMGRWRAVARRYVLPALRQLLDLRRDQVEEKQRRAGEAAVPPVDVWAPLRGVAGVGALGVLDAETARGLVGDVDHQRLLTALERVRREPGRLAGLLDAVREYGAVACAHPSGARDLVGRSLAHDLLMRQLRLGAVENVPKNPAGYRGADLALDPLLLGTSLLAVGPAGSGKTTRLARPVAEALCLQALTGSAVVVVVGAADADLGPASWYDVVVAPGDPHTGYGLDLFGGAVHADEAAARLADALLPDELALRTESARLVLQQIVGPFESGYGRLPGVRELVLLLRGEERAWAALLAAVQRGGALERHQHELAQRERMHGLADDPGTLLADRLALLDRPVFAGSFNPSAGDGPALPLFALRALDHPLRVRIALPEHSHPEASRILARLAVGQFLHAAASRADRSLFAGLVVDDASAAVDTHAIRGLQRLRGANAGAVLGLRTLVDLPEALRAPLFGAVGGRMAFPGMAPWDGKLFEEAWGTVWVDERDVTRSLDTSGGIVRRSFRGMRALLEGERAQTESVTTRKVERRRWSASDLAQVLPRGHAVVSLTSVDGSQVPPLLVRLP
ncbi:ATP-binding protein [Streptacidiphilus sp. MAP12-33]|uniref:ATP-binding protein n=1 Tax=Streptacidiphilus sp. MAP12-33 TaxID=3156266 RepID=UPI003513EFB3